MNTILLKTKEKRIAYMKKNMFVTSPVTYSRISTETLIKNASTDSGIPQSQVAAVFYALSLQIEELLLIGHSLQLGDLGYFYLSMNAHATEDKKDAGAKTVYHKAVRFRQSKKLQNLINANVTLESTGKLSDEDEEDDDQTDSGN